MNTKRIWLLLGFSFLPVGLAFLLWPNEETQPSLYLSVIRHPAENESPVFFFRVKGAENTRIHIDSVYESAVDGMGAPPTKVITVLDQSRRSLQALAISDPRMSRKMFGVP